MCDAGYAPPKIWSFFIGLRLEIRGVAPIAKEIHCAEGRRLSETIRTSDGGAARPSAKSRFL